MRKFRGLEEARAQHQCIRGRARQASESGLVPPAARRVPPPLPPPEAAHKQAGKWAGEHVGLRATEDYTTLQD